MHAGVVLACDTPSALVAARGSASLEEAFIAYIADATGEAKTDGADAGEPGRKPWRCHRQASERGTRQRRRSLNLGRLLAYSRRETLEIRRDPVRLAFAFVGSLVLMLAFGFGITTDVENIRFASLDFDQTPESRAYLAEFEGSRYFVRRPTLVQPERSRTAAAGQRDLAGDRGSERVRPQPQTQTSSPEISAVVDGANPFRAESIKQYGDGVNASFIDRRAASTSSGVRALPGPIAIQSRYRYNPSFESIYAIVPSIPPILLILIPAILMAVSVVREKELGSIINFYVTPTTPHRVPGGQATSLHRDRDDELT